MDNRNLTPELLEKAKAAKSAEELLTLAEENSVNLTAEQASAYQKRLRPISGELADEELENVAGGGCNEPRSGKMCYGGDKVCDKHEYNGYAEADHLQCFCCVFWDGRNERENAQCCYPEKRWDWCRHI